MQLYQQCENYLGGIISKVATSNYKMSYEWCNKADRARLTPGDLDDVHYSGCKWWLMAHIPW